jgi:putative ABC transport system permease protein
MRETLEQAWGIQLLLFNRRRLLASCAGMAVAVLVMFIELGLLLGILDSQGMIASRADGDLVVMNVARTNLHKWTAFDRVRLSQIASVDGVAQVMPVYQGIAGMLDPDDNAIRRILVLAFAPRDMPLALGIDAATADTVQQPGTVLFDRLSRPIYGAVAPGGSIELDGINYNVGGLIAVGPDIVTDGTVIMSEGTWLAHHPDDRPIMGVIRLVPGTGVAAARARIAAQLPDDVSVMTPGQVWRREMSFTLRSAPIGILFGIGMVAGLVIGSITCYQILFNQIVDHIAQYATLAAMGFSELFLRRLILEQAVLLAWGGFGLAIIVAWAFDRYVAAETALAVRLGSFSILTILLLATIMSIGAGLLALRRVTDSDVADLY